MYIKASGMANVLAITQARVPLCKFYDPEFDLRCDITVGNMLGVENTRMIRTYLDIHPVVQPLIQLVKHWAGRRDINDPANGSTISSYAYSLMVINFLQRQSILPCLQKLKPEPPKPNYVVVRKQNQLNRSNEYRMRERNLAGRIFYRKERMPMAPYETDAEGGPRMNFPDTIKWNVTFESQLSHPQVSPMVDKGEELRGEEKKDALHAMVLDLFFKFAWHFGWEFDYMPKSIISVRKGTILGYVPDLLWKNQYPQLVLVVEDPFQVSTWHLNFVLCNS
jgi:DNA polymerase sigma